MGATTFGVTAKGPSAQEAFDATVRDYTEQYGNRGYTGTIAEKDSFTTIPLPEGIEPGDYADLLISKGDKRIEDKYGPAGCFDLKDGSYYFFGWAAE